MPQHIVIIGNGIAGITCARNIRKLSDHSITVISSETEHFYSRTALMYIYMGHMKYEHTKPYEDFFWKKNRIGLVMDHVEKIDYSGKKLHLVSGKTISYDSLVLATGSVSNKPGFKGANLQGVQGLYGMPDLLQMEANTVGVKNAVIVGGGLIGIEMAEMLLSRNIHVSFLVRELLYWDNVLPHEEAAMVSRHIRDHHIDLRTSTELDEIIGDGKVEGVRTKSGEIIECQFVGLTVGVSPNISLAKDSELQTGRGILVNEYFETSIPDVYAIGDCVEHRDPPPGRKKIEQIWYTGKFHGQTLALTLCGKRSSYDPGPFFNSAKFLDIEYQTYGRVNARAEEHEDCFYWEHPGGKIGLRLVYQRSDRKIIGFNAMGIRLRHALCDQILREEWKVDQVIDYLDKINFDPEFFENYGPAIREAYSQSASSEALI